MRKILKLLLPHAAIVLAGMYIVLFLIDRVNTAMCFIDNDITKTLILILSVLAIANAALIRSDERRRAKRKKTRR